MDKRKSFPETKKSTTKAKESDKKTDKTEKLEKIGKNTQDLFNALDQDSGLFKKILNEAGPTQLDQLENEENTTTAMSTINESLNNEKKIKKKRKNLEPSQSDGESDLEKEDKRPKSNKTKKLNKNDPIPPPVRRSLSKEPEKDKKEKISKPKSKEKNQKKSFTDKEAYVKIKKFMIEQNRPYSVQNIIDLNKGQIKKAQVQKTLDKLLEEDIVIMKEYNTKIYLANQNQFENINQNEIDALDKQTEKSKKELAEAREMHSALISEYKNLCEELSDEELNRRIMENKKQLLEIENAVKMIEKNKYEEIPIEKMKEAEKLYEDNKNKYRKTRKVCLSVLEYLEENLELKKKEIYVRNIYF
jgi:hypothetical protein